MQARIILARFLRPILELCAVARSNVWLLEGTEEVVGQTFRILFAGGDKQKAYIAQLAFNNSCRITWLGKRYFWNILHLLHSNHYNCQLAFIEGHSLHRLLYQRAVDYYTPLWVESRVDIPLKATNKSAREDLRRIRKNHLSYEVTKDAEALRDFYDNMYLPTIRARHGQSAVSSSYEKILSVISEGDNQLLLVKQEETPIAGVLITMRDIPKLWLAGVRNSNNVYRRMAVIGASYYFPAQFLSARGYRQMDLGRSRSFFNDGVFQYKNKWRHRLSGYDTDGMIVKVLTLSEAIKRFLIKQPFASIENKKLVANVFVDGSNESQEEVQDKINPLYSLEGLDAVKIYALDGPPDSIQLMCKQL